MGSIILPDELRLRVGFHGPYEGLPHVERRILPLDRVAAGDDDEAMLFVGTTDEFGQILGEEKIIRRR